MLEENNSTKLLDFFVALSFKPCVKIVRNISKYVDTIIDKDLNDFWREGDIHLYKYLIMSFQKYGFRECKIKEDQINLYYKIVKLLTITRNYSSRIWNEIRQQLLKCIRIYYKNTKKKLIDNLKEELIDYDVAITCSACKTLYCIHECDGTMKNIVDILTEQKKKNSKYDDEKVMAVAYGLKLLSIKNKDILNSLDAILSNSNNHEDKNTVRILLTEMGGFTAINKLKENQNMREKYMEMTGEAQKKVEVMFDKSIRDEKKGFKYSLYMNLVVFGLGITLLGVSGFMAIFNDSQNDWAGVGLSAGTGFLSVVYSLFINKPSRKIRKSTNHLM